MALPNGSGRQSGFVSIPVEIIRDSTSTGSGSHSRHNSPFRTLQNDSPYVGFSDSPPWSSNSPGRFQPRQSPSTAYDRVITNSQFNQPLNDRPSYQQQQQQEPPQQRHSQQRMYEPGPSHFSRSSEDLLSSPFDSIRYSTQPQYTSLIPPSFGSGFRPESDFVQTSKYTSPLRRSYDALNDFTDMHQSFPTTRQHPSEQQQQQQQQPYYRTTYQTQHQPQPQPQQQQQQQQPTYVNQNYINPNIVYTNEYGVPTDRYQPNTFQGTGNIASDPSRSPKSQRGASPARPAPSAPQQQEEPELKMAKDTTGPIPMPAPTSSSPSQPTDSQIPPSDTTAPTYVPPPPPPAPEPVRDPDAIALDKLEQIKQTLDDLEKEVDVFTGSTRNERAYKTLDEQALKIMIRCDELVDVSADIKEKRREMVRNVERLIAKLESKVPSTPAAKQNSNPIETITSADQSSVNNNSTFIHNERGNSEKKSSPSLSPPKENTSSTTTTAEKLIST